MGDAPDAYVYRPGQAEMRWLGEPSAYFLATGKETEERFASSTRRAFEARRSAAQTSRRPGVLLCPGGRTDAVHRRSAGRAGPGPVASRTSPVAAWRLNRHSSRTAHFRT